MNRHCRDMYEAYKAFMRRHRETVWSVCYDFALGDITRCEDMAQEVWIMLWMKFDQLQEDAGERKQRAWVRKVTHNVLVDLYRRKSLDRLPGSSNSISDVSDMSDLSDQSEDSDVAERIDDLMAYLTPDEQHLMRMRLDGYSAEEIAADLGMERNAVYKRASRIIMKLRRRYGVK